MRQSLLLVLLLVGCVAKAPDPNEPASSGQTLAVTDSDIEVPEDEAPPAKRFPDSPFLPAVIRAGLLECDCAVVDAIDPCGSILVDGTSYFVLYVHRYLWLSSYNQRGGSYWLICDAALRPVWRNPDWGGTPGRCFENKIQVDLTDKFFEINEEYNYGDLLTFKKDGDRLVASIDWASDESRIAQALNWPKWRDDSHEPDEEVTQLIPLAGHPDWRIVLTTYGGPQGCATLMDVNADNEFGAREITGLFAGQRCIPVHAGSVRPAWSPWTFVWIDWDCRAARYRIVGVICGEEWTKLGTDRR